VSEHDRARVAFALGVARSTAPVPEELLAAVPAFESARALAGPGSLRHDATYDLGSVHLLEGERHYRSLPEVGGAAPQPAPMQAAPPAPGAAPEEPEDPLARAREEYLLAKGYLIERLRSDWSDADTRADLELVQRRLKALDAIERERERQRRQERDDQQRSRDGRGDEDRSRQDERGEPRAGDDANPRDSPDEEPRDRPGDERPRDEEPGDEDAPQRTEEVPRPESEVEPPAPGGDPEERHLTREEVMRLLDRLRALEEQGERLRQMLRQARRVPVPRDW
jgi:hypothetical protein